MRRTRPISPSRMRSAVSERMGAWCQLCTVCSTRPAERAARGRRRRSAGELTSGFSHSTCRPRSRALRMSGAWLEGGGEMSTKSSGSPASKSSGESYQRAPGSRASHSARWAGRESAAATIRTSGRPSHPGKCPWMATLPSPMTAPRSMLLEPVLPDYRPQSLVEDGEPAERGLFTDDQRRVDAHRRGIRHRGKPAPEALLVEGLRHVLAERLLGPAVLDQLH